MPRLFRSSFWVVVLAFALALIAWSASERARHVARVAAIGATTETTAAAGRARLIVPERLAASYGWLSETRQMLVHHEPRVRHVDYENAPFGHDVATASPYRWWLGLVAVIDHLFASDSGVRALERAAVLGDPLLYALAVVSLVSFVARCFGGMRAALAGIALATLYPLACAFIPGAPSDRGLIAVLELASVLLLTYAVVQSDPARVRRGFIVAGMVAGFALWLSPPPAVALLLGVGGAALVAAWLRRSASADTAPACPLPWRAWAATGAAVTLFAYLVEYFPAHLGGWELRAVHPLYGIAWLGAGEVLGQVTEAIERRRYVGGMTVRFRLLAGVLGVAALGVVMWKTHQAAFLSSDLSGYRLADVPEAPVAASFAGLLGQSSQSVTVAILVLPLLLVLGALVAVASRAAKAADRTAVLLAVGPTLLTFGFGCRQIAWWAEVDALVVATVVVGAYAMRDLRFGTSFAALLTVAFCGPGLVLALPHGAQTSDQPSESEVFSLIDRDLAEWLAQHAPGGQAVFIAPPNDTVALAYYGGGRGVATLSWQNKAGLEAAVRILSASTPEEAETLIERRGITHLIMPSWDPYLDEYARMGMGQLDGTFLQRLHEWRVPGWLRPVAYTLPVIPGFERQSVTVFEVVEKQSDAVALSRTAEYFLELQRLREATAVAQQLRRFPADMNAWIARAEVEVATGDNDALNKSLGVLLPYLAAKRDRTLPWDLRLGLAVVLARSKHTDQARQQVQRCVADLTEARIRGLSTGGLYRLLVLSRAYDAPIKDPALAELARSLLPAEARARL